MNRLRNASDISVYEKRLALGKGLNTTAKLTEADVKSIRKRYAESGSAVTATSIAREYNVRPRTIQDVLNYKSWAHI